MLINNTDKEYIILEEDDIYPLRLNKKEADKFIKDLSSNISTLHEILNNTDSSLRDFVLQRTLLYSGMITSHYTEEYIFDTVIKNLNELSELLKNGKDQIPEPEELMVLENLGFKREIGDPFWYEKILEDNDDKEVVEEIFFRDKFVYRKRTIEWEKTNYGKSSKNIDYEDLEIDDKLRMVMQNTYDERLREK